MTFEKEITSNECSIKEITLFEESLYQQFKELEQDYNGLSRVLDKFHKLEQEPNGTISEENRE